MHNPYTSTYIEAIVVQVEDVLGVLFRLEQAPEARNDDLQEVRHLHVQGLRDDLQHLKTKCSTVRIDTTKNKTTRRQVFSDAWIRRVFE